MSNLPYANPTRRGTARSQPKLTSSSTQDAFTFDSWGYVVAVCALALAFVTGPLHIPFAPLVLTVIASLALAVANLPSLLILGMPVYAFVGIVLSNDLIQSGQYIKEQFRTGYESGASAVLSCYVIAFLLVGHATITYIAKRAWGRVPMSESLRRWSWAGVAILALATAAVLGAVIVIFGAAKAVGGDRFIYWSTLPDEVSKAISLIRAYALPMLAALAGFYSMALRKRYALTAVLLALPHVALFLMGEKMSAFTATITSFLFGMGIASIATGRMLRLTSKLIAGLTIAGAAVSLLTVIGFERTTSSDATTALVERLVLQGHVWFGTFELAVHGPFLTIAELAAPNTADNPTGLNLLSYAISDPAYVYSRSLYGLTFTMGGPPAALAAFGVVGGILAYAACSFTYAALTAMLVYFLTQRAFASAAVLLFGLPLTTNIVLMGFLDDSYNAVSISIMLWTVGTFVFLTLRRLRTKRLHSDRTPSPHSATIPQRRSTSGE